jgi:triphosphoribosyl-dephospho-CoA synthase
MLGGNAQARTVADTAAQLAKLPDDAAPKVFSKGLRATHRYRVPGAREEAQQAFPHIMQRALPQLRLSRLNGGTEAHARLDALMAIMTSLTDTCVLSRAGMEGLDTMQNGARAVLAAGGTAHPEGQRILALLDKQMLLLNASPGGAADLLAATLFLDRIETPYLAN